MAVATPFHVIIPARYHSIRLPGKVLLDIAGKPMIQHVYEQAKKSGAQSVIVATDNENIKAIVAGFAGKVCMTSHEHLNGTDRIAEAVKILGLDDHAIIVNVQGDLPLIPPTIINQVANNLALHDNAAVATLSQPINDIETIKNPHAVKVVTDKFGYALYFSRAPIAWEQAIGANNSASNDQEQKLSQHYKHIGIYASRVGFIKRYVSWPPCAIEQAESLEQLRILWHGERIHVDVANETPHPGVDTQADLQKVREMIKLT